MDSRGCFYGVARKFLALIGAFARVSGEDKTEGSWNGMRGTSKIYVWEGLRHANKDSAYDIARMKFFSVCLRDKNFGDV